MANDELKVETNRSGFFGRYLAKPISYFIFILWTTITVLPLLWMLYSSFKTNEELTRNIYSFPYELLHAKEASFDVVPPQTNIMYPDGLLEKYGITSSRDYEEINKHMFILESPNIGAHKRIKVHFIERTEIPEGTLTEDGRDLRNIQPGVDVQIKCSDLPKNIQNRVSWQTIWWNYTSAWQRGGLGMGFINSLIYTIVSTFCVVLFGLMLSYGITKFSFKKLAALVSALIALGYLLDINQLIVPLFLMLSNLGLTNTHIGVILVYVAFGLPLAVMLGSTFIRGLPDSLVESAYIDGANPMRTFISIIIPMTVPVIVTISIQTALGIWNEYLLVMVLASAEATKSLPVGIFSFSSRTGLQLGWQIAALVIATLPVLVVYFIFQKDLAKGVAGGAIKE
ncbi:MAG: carbohydrate ABC transporter permease [Spirochaetaceae bacterium]|nr:carbohydrate ABC transporter permease [Spirochaetaceae bacterium]